ncbi:unnamed protein product, partial [Phaeothamnion confervicola]
LDIQITIANATTEAMERHVAARADDASLLRELGVCHATLGNLLEQNSFDLALALKSFKRAQEIFESLLEANPDDSGARRDTIVSLMRMEEALRREGEIDELVGLLERKLEIGMDGYLRDESDHDNVSLIASTHVGIGDLAAYKQNYEVAQRSFEKAVGISRILVEAVPGSMEYRRRLALAADRLGNL